jgi:hypothetical protein
MLVGPSIYRRIWGSARSFCWLSARQAWPASTCRRRRRPSRLHRHRRPHLASRPRGSSRTSSRRKASPAVSGARSITAGSARESAFERLSYARAADALRFYYDTALGQRLAATQIKDGVASANGGELVHDANRGALLVNASLRRLQTEPAGDARQSRAFATKPVCGRDVEGGGSLSFGLSAEHHSLHYEIVRELRRFGLQSVGAVRRICREMLDG